MRKRIRAIKRRIAAVAAEEAGSRLDFLGDGGRDLFNFSPDEVTAAPASVKKKRGRPKTAVQHLASRRLGRPKKWTNERRGQLLDFVMKFQSQHTDSTAKAALEAYRKAMAEELGLRRNNPHIPGLKVLQNQLTLARRLPEKSQ